MKIFTRWMLGPVLLLLPVLLHAQTPPITLEQAVELFKENSLQQKLARLDALRKKGEAVRYKAYPNPEIDVFREQLNSGSIDYQETTYQISQPLELLGQPFLRNKSASYSRDAAELNFEYERQRLIALVKSLYAEYWYLKNKLGVQEEAMTLIQQARQSAADRRDEGMFSGIQVQRFNVELNRYRKQRDEVRMNLQEVGNQLESMIFSDVENKMTLTIRDTLMVPPVPGNEQAIVEKALRSRADYRALGKLREVSDLKLKVEKRDRLPDLNLDVGYKTQSDGAEGFVIGGSIKLPIFNQNRGNVTIARAEQQSRKTSLQLRQREIRNEVEAALQQVKLLLQQWQSLQEQPVEASYLETAQFSYSEGRYSLLELLDAIDAYTQGRSLTYQTIAEYNQALYRLELVSGGTLFSTQQNQDQ